MKHHLETANTIEEIQPAMEVIGPVLEQFDKNSEIYYPIDTSFKGNIDITSSFDPQSHFENDIFNVIKIYEKITGTKLDLNLEEESFGITADLRRKDTKETIDINACTNTGINNTDEALVELNEFKIKKRLYLLFTKLVK